MGREDKRKTNLERVYPKGAKVLEWQGVQVAISPLKIKQLADIAPAFGILFDKISRLRAEGKNDADVVKECMNEVLQIVQPCIDQDVGELPSALMPDLITTFFEQNLSSDVLGKWMALGQSVVGLLGPRATEAM